MKKLEGPIYKSESDKYDDAAGNVGGFISQEQVNTAKILDADNKPKDGSFGAMASNIVDEILGSFDNGYTLEKAARGVPVGTLFTYKKALMVKTPFKTIVGGQVYINVLQDRILQLTTVSAETEIKELKTQLYTVTNGGFFDLIKLAFKRLIKGRNNGK